MKPCPFCHESNDDDEIVCAHCARHFATGTLPGLRVEVSSTPSGIVIQHDISAALGEAVGPMTAGFVRDGMLTAVETAAALVDDMRAELEAGRVEMTAAACCAELARRIRRLQPVMPTPDDVAP